VFTKGTAAGVGPLDPWPSAGKTGTTDGPYDSWFVGYTAQRSTAVWVADPGRPGGGDSMARRRLTGIEVAGHSYPIIYGATLAAPLWKEVTGAAMQGMPARRLP
jgi:membrane peptidoglycan carboxypeptidase